MRGYFTSGGWFVLKEHIQRRCLCPYLKGGLHEVFHWLYTTRTYLQISEFYGGNDKVKGCTISGVDCTKEHIQRRCWCPNFRSSLCEVFHWLYTLVCIWILVFHGGDDKVRGCIISGSYKSTLEQGIGIPISRGNLHEVFYWLYTLVRICRSQNSMVVMI